MFEASPSKKFENPISKIIRAKRAGAVAEVVELPSKLKALSTNSSIGKKKKKSRDTELSKSVISGNRNKHRIQILAGCSVCPSTLRDY
jgi:hypothetical protein